MLRLSDVHTHYGLSHVLQGVSLSVGAGEVVGLFGRNGVGKTTLIKTVAGWVKPSSGCVEFDGAPIDGLASDVICRRGIGLVPEDRRVFPSLSVEENLELGAMQAPRRARAETRRKLDAIYTRFPRLGERRAQQGTTLSGGEQQMLAMARVLMGEPRLLLIDEPSEGLAPKIVDEVFSLIDSMRKDGIPIVLVEQNVRRALDVVTRFYALERGQIVFEGDATKANARSGLMKVLAL
ncbi:MAG: ABC transporter ATP-binding protein [Burkholderiaceae bacterium]|jgi:branched-chain amino acid transport system ATP-binding protein|nr:ABC transporter ATP-binding protein [Burkholderiaceae bacterium]